MDEKELIRELIITENASNSQAFTHLYNSYYSKVYHFAKLYINSEHDIAEIVQDVFVKLWEKRHTLSVDKNLEGFLFIMTRNLIFNADRARIRESVFKMTVIRAMEAVEAYNMEDDLIATDLKQYIDELIDQLPARQREIFIMSREQQLSYREIAEHFNITEKAVERHIYLALKFLKKNIVNLLIMLLVAKSFELLPARTASNKTRENAEEEA